MISNYDATIVIGVSVYTQATLTAHTKGCGILVSKEVPLHRRSDGTDYKDGEPSGNVTWSTFAGMTLRRFNRCGAYAILPGRITGTIELPKKSYGIGFSITDDRYVALDECTYITVAIGEIEYNVSIEPKQQASWIGFFTTGEQPISSVTIRTDEPALVGDVLCCYTVGTNLPTPPPLEMTKYLIPVPATATIGYDGKMNPLSWKAENIINSATFPSTPITASSPKTGVSNAVSEMKNGMKGKNVVQFNANADGLCTGSMEAAIPRCEVEGCSKSPLASSSRCSNHQSAAASLLPSHTLSSTSP
jgi:hypothetical protein